MAINFKDLKRGSSDSFEKLRQEVEKTNSNKYSKDERYWEPTVDKDGNGSAIIRFLPACEGEEIPFVKYFDHGFKGPTGRWYINLSRTTLGEDDPVSELNSRLWNSSKDDESPARKMARAQRRQLHYVSNILVVRDPGNASNEGKVFLYRYGAKIWKKLNDIMHPEFEGDEAINPFDMWTGANFRLLIKKESGYRSYESSKFESAKPVADSDEAIEKIWSKTYPLLPEVAPNKFKSYEELQANLRSVIGNSADLILGETSTEEPTRHANPPVASKEPVKPATTSTSTNATEADAPWNEAASQSISDEEEDEALKFFKDIAG